MEAGVEEVHGLTNDRRRAGALRAGDAAFGTHATCHVAGQRKSKRSHRLRGCDALGYDRQRNRLPFGSTSANILKPRESAAGSVMRGMPLAGSCAWLQSA